MICDLFVEEEGGGGGSKKKIGLGGQFRNQLVGLVTGLKPKEVIEELYSPLLSPVLVFPFHYPFNHFIASIIAVPFRPLC